MPAYFIILLLLLLLLLPSRTQTKKIRLVFVKITTLKYVLTRTTNSEVSIQFIRNLPHLSRVFRVYVHTFYAFTAQST